MDLLLQIAQVLTELFVLALGLGVLVVIALYIADRTQTRHSLRRNFPVLARFRYLFEKLGEFSVNTFLPRTAENCRSIEQSAVGFIGLPRVRTLRLPSALLAASDPRVRYYS